MELVKTLVYYYGSAPGGEESIMEEISKWWNGWHNWNKNGDVFGYQLWVMDTWGA